MKGLTGLVLLLWVPLALSQQPYFKAKEKETRFEGPGREDPEPADVTEVRIGYFGPGEPAHPEAGDIWLAVNLAVEEANAAGGYQGKPFTLLPRWAENPWGNGGNLVARLVFVDRVWAIIGGIDGPSTHIAEQIAAKAHLPLIGPATTDKSANMANIPWMFSASPGDHLLAPVVGRALLDRAKAGRVALVAATDHDSHQFLVELDKYVARSPVPIAYRFEFQTGQDLTELAAKMVAAKPATVVLIAGSGDSALLVNLLRKEGFAGAILGGPAMGRRLFRRQLASAPGAIFFPVAADASSDDDEFGRRFAAKFGFAPDYAARYAYESTRLLVAALRSAGLNRVRIGDALRSLSPWKGPAASIEWDPLGQNSRPAILHRVALSRAFSCAK